MRSNLKNETAILSLLGQGIYSVTREGRVFSKRTFRELSQMNNPGGYKNVVLCEYGKRYRVLVHRLVWLAFNGPIAPGMEINHLNGQKTDNRLENLAVVTPAENTTHARNTGLRKPERLFRKRVNNTSGFIGVARTRSRKTPWSARITVAPPERSIWLGQYTTAEQAAMVRDAAAMMLFGDQTALNFPWGKCGVPTKDE